MMMQEETEKKSIRNLIQAAAEPEMHPDFESRLTQAWLEKSHANHVAEDTPKYLQILTLPSQQLRFGLVLLLLIVIGFGYWQHLRELEELRQFDVLLEFSMGTL
ncbi:MAG: hypothetical protein EB072_12515 [Betaproteobacteria bacterium]|nr:hypothetical protein [Betaproteobacteria bacterium]